MHLAEYEELDVYYEETFDVEPMETIVKTDYVGTGCRYQDVTGQAISIYNLTELDQNQWMVRPLPC